MQKIRSKYRSYCKVCKKVIKVGDWIYWGKEEGVVHTGCRKEEVVSCEPKIVETGDDLVPSATNMGKLVARALLITRKLYQEHGGQRLTQIIVTLSKAKVMSESLEERYEELDYERGRLYDWTEGFDNGEQ